MVAGGDQMEERVVVAMAIMMLMVVEMVVAIAVVEVIIGIEAVARIHKIGGSK